ncbi:MAG: LLM class flavin-dependent oxidoreductase [Acidimicrobiales bacterium]
MKIGITLPQFRDDPEHALAAARAAEELGLDGVFVFDHLWAIGNPERPALPAFPLLGALTSVTTRVSLGTLVARVGLVPDAVLVHQFTTLAAIVGDRLIAGVGTGDRLSAAENDAYGIDYPPAADRRRQVAEVCDALRGEGIVTWVGGRTEATRQVAIDHADAVNFWAADASVVAAERRMPVTWGGQIAGEPGEASVMLRSLAEAGAAWAVCAPPFLPDVDPAATVSALAEAAALR